MLSLSKTCAQLAAVEPGSSYALQDICDKLVDGAGPGDLEQLLVAAGAAYFPQADTWAKAWSPMRCVVAHIPDKWCISALVLPRGGKIEWQRHDKANSISTTIFGNLAVTDLEIQDSGETRKLEQLELEATHADAWAVGGSDESDCVCRGGRCPRMWDCPFWVERRRAEAKGSSAHVALRVPRDASSPHIWRGGPKTVRMLEALEPSALLDIQLGQPKMRYYREIPSTLEDAVELVEVIAPLGVKPGVCRYTGPAIHLPE
ncbi:unnamed protein product [Ascophyllum nodosum]